MPFFLYISTFTRSEKVLENFLWGPGKVLDFFVSKRVGTLISVDASDSAGFSRWHCAQYKFTYLLTLKLTLCYFRVKSKQEARSRRM